MQLPLQIYSLSALGLNHVLVSDISHQCNLTGQYSTVRRVQYSTVYTMYGPLHPGSKDRKELASPGSDARYFGLTACRHAAHTHQLPVLHLNLLFCLVVRGRTS